MHPPAGAVAPHWLAHLRHDGYAIVEKLADDASVDALLAAIEAGATGAGDAARANGAELYALRNLLEIEAVRRWTTSVSLPAVARPVLGIGARPVRAILFDKTPGTNWKVAWHQDRSIAVRDRRDAPGFGPWSTKAGVTHVQPPVAVLENMLTIRLHLDDCDATNGPLRVIPESHAAGVLSPQALERWTREHEAVSCEVARGGALLMRPLLLHASSAATRPRHRRVVHVEFAGGDLPGGLEWHAGRLSANPAGAADVS